MVVQSWLGHSQVGGMCQGNYQKEALEGHVELVLGSCCLKLAVRTVKTEDMSDTFIPKLAAVHVTFCIKEYAFSQEFGTCR